MTNEKPEIAVADVKPKAETNKTLTASEVAAKAVKELQDIRSKQVSGISKEIQKLLDDNGLELKIIHNIHVVEKPKK